jgi:L-lactate dehydrogenase complex protein LldF
MSAEPKGYRERSRKLLAGENPRAAVTKATLHHFHTRERAYAELPIEEWRSYAEGVKNHLLSHLEHYLDQAERSLTAHGVQVHWAETAQEARAELARLVSRYQVKRVVKAKSMLSEELEVNPWLESLGVSVLESDLGEYVVQLAGETPSHIVGPAFHKTLADIQALFAREFGTPPQAAPDVLAAAARSRLRQAFLEADMGISGANFVVAETGTVALIENEGNIRITTSAPRVHVVLVGIEKLLPRQRDLAPFLTLTARAATGQRLGNYVSLIRGPKGGDPDGPEAVHLIFVDNGRLRLLADERSWETLRCLRCGACLNACPVYRQTGGHAYGWVYSGPIGAVMAPAMLGSRAAGPLPYASSLCGACAEVCPVKIPIPALLLAGRQRAVLEGEATALERGVISAYGQAMLNPALYRAGARALRLGRMALPWLRAWSDGRGGLQPSPKSFRELWSER